MKKWCIRGEHWYEGTRKTELNCFEHKSLATRSNYRMFTDEELQEFGDQMRAKLRKKKKRET